MPNNLVQFPREILEQILHQLPRHCLFDCLHVCHAWYISARHLFYEQITFSLISCLDRFITCMYLSPYDSNSYVRKIRFNFYSLRDLMLLIFEKQFPKLIQLCPHIEILSCAPRLADQVNKTLLRLSFPLKNLTVIPYSPEADYNACALLYRHSLTEYTIGNLESSLLTVGFDELKSFTNLKKLSLLQVPWCMFQDVEYILSMCPHVQDLSVDFCNETDDKHHVDLLSKLPLQQHYPRLKSLTIQCSLVDVHLNILYPVLRKCKNLSRLKLVGTCGFFDMAFDVPHNLEWDKLIEKLFETTNWK